MIFGYMYILWLLLYVYIVIIIVCWNYFVVWFYECVVLYIVVCVNKMLNRWIWVLFLRYEEEFYVIKKYI